MKLSNFVSGLEILRPYFNDPDGFHIGAEHDQFFVYATDRPVAEDDVTRLRALGWFQPEGEDGAPYDPADGWSAFT